MFLFTSIAIFKNIFHISHTICTYVGGSVPSQSPPIYIANLALIRSLLCPRCSVGSQMSFTLLLAYSQGPPSPTEETSGMIPRAVAQIFEEAARLQPRGWEFTLQATFVEIYLEEVRDLLGSAAGGTGPSAVKHEIHHKCAVARFKGKPSEQRTPKLIKTFIKHVLHLVNVFLTLFG